MAEFIFTMQDVSRVHPPDKRVLENITLAFFFGAKIGVIGTNGSGKSSLLRIMAGVDKDFLGEAHPAEGIRIGYFAQEPDLGSAKTVREAVDEAVSDIRGLVTEFEELSAKLGEPMSDDAMAKPNLTWSPASNQPPVRSWPTSSPSSKAEGPRQVLRLKEGLGPEIWAS